MQSPDLVKTNVILDPKKHYLSFVNFKAQSKKNYIKKSQSKALQIVGLVVYRQVCTKNSYSYNTSMSRMSKTPEFKTVQ